MQNENTGNKSKISPVVLLRTIYHSLAHFSNDLFLAFFAPTLPVLIEQMHLLKVQAGILNLGMELMALSMPLVGHLADKKDIRKYMFLTPAITALCMSSLTLVPNFYLLFIVLILGGLSIISTMPSGRPTSGRSVKSPWAACWPFGISPGKLAS